MAIPHQFIGWGSSPHSLICEKCGRPLSAVHEDGLGSCCFDFEAYSKRGFKGISTVSDRSRVRRNALERERYARNKAAIASKRRAHGERRRSNRPNKRMEVSA